MMQMISLSLCLILYHHSFKKAGSPSVNWFSSSPLKTELECRGEEVTQGWRAVNQAAGGMKPVTQKHRSRWSLVGERIETRWCCLHLSPRDYWRQWISSDSDCSAVIRFQFGWLKSLCNRCWACLTFRTGGNQKAVHAVSCTCSAKKKKKKSVRSSTFVLITQSICSV